MVSYRETILWKSGNHIVEIGNRFDKGIAFQLLAECKETFDRWKNVKSAFVLLFLTKRTELLCLL